MNTSRWAIGLLLLTLLAQLVLPASMIWQQEDLRRNAPTLKFKLTFGDPYDPFRGRYLRFQVEANTLKNVAQPILGKAYASYAEGNDGFAQLVAVSKDRPSQGPYCPVDAYYNKSDAHPDQMVTFPLPRFYLREDLADLANELFRREWHNGIASTPNLPEGDIYALVGIARGKVVLHDIFVAQQPLATYLEQHRDELLLAKKSRSRG